MKLLRIQDFSLLADRGSVPVVLSFFAFLIQSVHPLAKLRPLTLHLAGGIGVAAVLVVIAYGLVGVGLRIPEDLGSLLAGFGQDLLPGILQIAAAPLKRSPEGTDLIPVAGHLILGFLHGEPAVLQIGDHVFEVFFRVG